MEKEKTVAVTVRIPESLLLEVTELAKAFGVTRNKMLAVILEGGKVVADSMCDVVSEEEKVIFEGHIKRKGKANG